MTTENIRARVFEPRENSFEISRVVVSLSSSRVTT